MRRSSLYMLIAAVFLGLLAVFFARTFLVPSEAKRVTAAPQAVTAPAVVAGQAFAFGDKIDAAKLKVIQYPVNALPPGTFRAVGDILGGEAGQNRVALRAIDANEVLTEKSISSKTSRLSTSNLFNNSMRAMAIPLNEAAGAGGFVAPGDRVDVYLTHASSNEVPPYTTQLVQDVRVLAVGQDSNPGKDKPEVVKSITVELTPRQAQKVALAQTVGSMSVSLRPIVDESRVMLATARLEDLHDGPGKLKIPTVLPPAPPKLPPPPPKIEVEVYRGNKATTYDMGSPR